MHLRKNTIKKLQGCKTTYILSYKRSDGIITASMDGNNAEMWDCAATILFGIMNHAGELGGNDVAFAILAKIAASATKQYQEKNNVSDEDAAKSMNIILKSIDKEEE